MKDYNILNDLVKFNTIKDNQNEEIINYIETYLKKYNFKTEYKGKNLIMSIGEKPSLGFLGHTDTVEYIEGWDTDPFQLTNKEGKLYGLGACDMKGGIAAMMDAVSQIDFLKLKYGMKLYFTYDEEIGFGGIYEIKKAGEQFPNVMIFGEPTNNEILVGSKGLLEYELDFKGIKCHSSRPDKGKSANLNAIRFLSELDNWYNQGIKEFEEKAFEVPYTTMNVGIINGGSAINSIPAKCKVNIDFRIANQKQISKIKEKIEQLSKEYECNVKIIQEIKPFIDDIEFVNKTKTANFITEASFIDCKNRLILGPGPVTAHEVNEYIIEKSYKKLIEQYKNLINTICNNDI